MIKYFSVVLMVFVTSCSTKPAEVIQESIDNIPEFYINPPHDTSEYLYTVDSHISLRRDLARRQALLKANTNLASKVGSKVESLEKLFQEELTAGDSSNYNAVFTLATQQLTSEELRDVEQYQIKFQPTQDGRYECYVLLRIPTQSVRGQIENVLSRDQEFYLRLQESKAFEELLNNLERL
jgi:hypothetical protein